MRLFHRQKGFIITTSTKEFLASKSLTSESKPRDGVFRYLKLQVPKYLITVSTHGLTHSPWPATSATDSLQAQKGLATYAPDAFLNLAFRT